jgi:transmembrane E3 ubiquitin-protein ligase
MPPPPPPDPRSVIFAIVIILFYLNSSPEISGPPGSGFRSPREEHHAHLARQRHAYDILNTSKYGDFAPDERGGTYLNLTGFRKADGFAWEGLIKVKERVKLEREMRIGGNTLQLGVGMYENVTGVAKGKWVRSPGEITKLVATGRERLNLTQLAPGVNWGYGVWNHNITGKEGKIVLTIEEKDIEAPKGRHKSTGNESEEVPIREASATITIQDETSSGDGWERRLLGVHWPRRGTLVLTTTSDKYAGIFGLPHVMTTQEDFQNTQKILNGTLDTILKKKESSTWTDSNDPWSSSDSQPAPHCEYVVYVQVHPVKKDELYSAVTGMPTNGMLLEMEDIERELRFPNGAPTVEPPPLRMSLVVFSPDCGFMLESKGPPAYTPQEGQHLKGLKHEVYLRMVKHWSLVWTVTLFGQVLLLRLQMKEASTPSTVSRISYFTIATMVAVDALLFGCLMLLSSAAPAVFPTATLASFADFLSIGLGVKFTSDVYAVQEPERRERQQERERAHAARSTTNARRAASSTGPAITATGTGADSLPTTARRDVPADIPIIIPSDQDIDFEIAEVANASAAISPTDTQRQGTSLPRNSSDATSSWGLLGIVIISFLLVTLSSISWPVGIRSAYINTVSFIYLSFWAPQIYRNVIRNCRKALLWKFVIGQSILRAVPFIYFYIKEDNVLFAETSKISLAILLGWLWVQIWVLAAQEVLGPRFGVPKGWLPEAWDYHPILKEDDSEGGGMPIGLVQAPSSPGLERANTTECRKKSDGHTRCVDCAICMMVLEVPVVPAGVDSSSVAGVAGVNGMLARRQYMVTPCRHTFHSACLEGWMRFRLQCPICRENLPPL